MLLYFWSRLWYKMTSNSRILAGRLFFIYFAFNFYHKGNYVIISAAIGGITNPMGRQLGIEHVLATLVPKLRRLGHLQGKNISWINGKMRFIIINWSSGIHRKDIYIGTLCESSNWMESLKHYRILTKSPFHIYTYSTREFENVKFLLLVFKKVPLQISQKEGRSIG